MSVCLGNKEKREIFVGNTRIRSAYVGDILVYQYDTVTPVLTVEQPRGLSESAPEYISNLVNYKIWGYATDAASNVSVYVNNNKVVYFPPEGENGHWVYNDLDLILEEGKVYSYDIYAIDKAGNKTETITRYVCYDTAAPSLDVIAPTGVSAENPTYCQSDDTYMYMAQGYVDDVAGIDAMTVRASNNTDGTSTLAGVVLTQEEQIVNGVASVRMKWSAILHLKTNSAYTVTIVAKDKAGKTTTQTRYIRTESYYQQAARIAGATAQTSLHNTLTNSVVCSTMANNAISCDIMKSHYSAEMTEYVGQQSMWSNGLNKLCYNCKLKFYIIMNRAGALGFCANGGLEMYQKGIDGEDDIINVISGIPIDLTGYSKAKFVGYAKNTYGIGDTKIGFTIHPSVESDSAYDIYYMDNVFASVGVDSKWTMFSAEISINPTYKYLWLGMRLPLVNGYSQTGEAYYSYVAVMP